MLERETIHTQSEGTKSEAEKAAEEERRAAQDILEKLYDPFTENDWLVHYTKSFERLNSILQRGIYSETFADLKKKFGDGSVPAIKALYQGSEHISCWGKYSISNEATTIPPALSFYHGVDATGVIFSPIKNQRLLQGRMEGEELSKFKVARQRFKILVACNLCRNDERITLARKHHLPIIDYYYNLLYPLEIPAKDLQEITIPCLRELAKTLGIEKLRAMSVEEIKSAAGALKKEI